MNEIKIEHDVKVLSKFRDGAEQPWIELCQAMKVIENGRGDSVVLDRRQANCMRTSVLQKGMKVTIRELADGRFRVWRLK